MIRIIFGHFFLMFSSSSELFFFSGKLSTKQIKAGYAALKEIEALLNLQEFGKKFVQANNDFYTRIPHNFGMKIPPLIRTFQQMKEKMKLLEVNIFRLGKTLSNALFKRMINFFVTFC